MMIAAFLLPLLLTCLAAASGDLRLAQVGIEGYYSIYGPTAVTVEVYNPLSEPQEFVIDYEIRTPLFRKQYRTDYVQQPLQLAPGERRMHSAPILFKGNNPVLTVKLHDGKGRLFGDDQQELSKTAGYLVVLLCQDAGRCESTEKQVQSAGTIREQADKQQRFTFVRLGQPFDKWWKYLGSANVILAEAMPLKPEQRQALEEYVRQGGTLIDVSGGSKIVFSNYTSTAQFVSKGALYRTTDFNNPQLNAYLSGGPGPGFYYFSSFGNDLSYFRSHLGTSFRFPRLRWLLAWFAVYILVMGPLNFFILRKLKRLEFGWLSVPALAVVFAVGFYWWGARDRPRQFGVEETAVYWLDDQSPVAAVDLGVRVLSPERTQAAVSVPTEAIFARGGDSRQGFGLEGIFFGRAKSPVEGSRLWLGPPQQMELEMARWSFSDLEYSDVKRLAGTVRVEKGGVLNNATGKRFREAVYVDAQGKAFELGAVGDGNITLPADGGRSLVDLRDRRNRGEEVKGSVLLEYLLSPPHSTDLKRSQEAFLGLSEEPVLNASLKDVFFTRKNHAITIVRFGDRHE